MLLPMNIAVITAHAEGCHVLSVIAQDWAPPVTNFKLKTGATVFHLAKSPRRIFHPAMHSKISVGIIASVLGSIARADLLHQVLPITIRR
jgi:hypothetical protein